MHFVPYTRERKLKTFKVQVSLLNKNKKQRCSENKLSKDLSVKMASGHQVNKIYINYYL